HRPSPFVASRERGSTLGKKALNVNEVIQRLVEAAIDDRENPERVGVNDALLFRQRRDVDRTEKASRFLDVIRREGREDSDPSHLPRAPRLYPRDRGA